jgi:3-isopropylmalate/(R)-2-methylmalate dehydratase small subunit
MKPFTCVSGIAAPMPAPNINTDLIAPILVPGRSPGEAAKMSYGEKMFANLRYDRSGEPRGDFILNRKPFRDARFLIAGPNFGCGSSRESAVWALQEFGVRAVIAPSFAEIFMENAYQNGLLPLVLGEEEIDRIAGAAAGDTPAPIIVDLEAATVIAPGLQPIPFDIPDHRRRMLLRGLDQLGMILEHESEICSFESEEAALRPWMTLSRAALRALHEERA